MKGMNLFLYMADLNLVCLDSIEVTIKSLKVLLDYGLFRMGMNIDTASPAQNVFLCVIGREPEAFLVFYLLNQRHGFVIYSCCSLLSSAHKG